jgi:hypothetical protein
MFIAIRNQILFFAPLGAKWQITFRSYGARIDTLTETYKHLAP